MRASLSLRKITGGVFLLLVVACVGVSSVEVADARVEDATRMQDTTGLSSSRLKVSPDLVYTSLQKPKAGDFLADMEWTKGSEDISAETDTHPFILAAKPGEVLPSKMFGVFTDAQGNPVTSLYGNPAQAKDIHADDQIAAAMVRAYSSDVDATSQGDQNMLKEYRKLISVNSWYYQRLAELFAVLDRNNDGTIDNQELEYAVGKGYLSVVGARMLKTWDINFSHRVSWLEFKYGPLWLSLLETNTTLLAQFQARLPGAEEHCTAFYRSILGTYDANTPAAFGLLEMSSEWSRPSSKSLNLVQEDVRRERAMSMEQNARNDALSLLGLQTEAWRADRENKFFDKVKAMGGKILNGAKKLLFGDKGGKKGKKGKKPDPRPVSKFGIPAEIDETCVVCQYIVERTQKDLQKRVVDDYTAFDDIPNAQAATGGMDGLQQVLGRSGSIRSRRAPLMPSRGQQSPIRMLLEVVETRMRASCGRTAPTLFRQGCNHIWQKRWRLAQGIFEKWSPGSICEQANICTEHTYFGVMTAVHLPINSFTFNRKSGKCGLMGGAHSRVEGAWAQVHCAAKSLVKGIATQFHNQQAQ